MIELPGGLRVSLPGGVAADGAVLCSLRPEKLWVTAPGSGQVRGVIRSRLFLGNHWLFQLTSDLGELLVYQQNTNHAPPEEGDVVGVDWHPASLRFCRRSRFARDGNPWRPGHALLALHARFAALRRDAGDAAGHDLPAVVQQL
ncbi:MAG: TOBE domain-containing protein [Acetobacteraceae bacterium]